MVVNAYVYNSQAGAQALSSPVDAALGYPKAGVNVGGGAHVTPLFVTLGYAAVLQHPTLSLWAYISDAVTIPIVGPNAISLNLPAPTTLDATWLGAQAVGVP